MQDKVLSLLGLAAKAGKVQSGEFSVEKTVKAQKAFLVVVAEDASENTKKHFFDICAFRSVPIFEYGTKESLGRCIGKQSRASLALTDEGFSEGLKTKLQEENS